MLHDKKDIIKKFSQENPCLCFNIRKASRLITQIYDDALRGLGYTPSQVMILSGIRELHSAMINELAEALCTDRTTVSRNVRLLQKQGLVKPCDCQDRWAKAIMLTDKGRGVLDAASKIWNSKHKDIVGAVGVNNMEQFLKNLNEVVGQAQKR